MSSEQPSEHLARIKRMFPLWSIRPVSEGHGWTAHRPGYRDVWAATLPDLEARLLDVRRGRGPGH
jgi:hypothetical protein